MAALRRGVDVPAFWGALVAILGNLVKTQIGFWIASALAAFGLHLVVSKFALEPALDAIISAASGMGADALAWFRYLGCDKFITTVLSAYVAAASFAGIRMAKKAI